MVVEQKKKKISQYQFVLQVFNLICSNTHPPARLEACSMLTLRLCLPSQRSPSLSVPLNARVSHLQDPHLSLGSAVLWLADRGFTRKIAGSGNHSFL